MFTGSIRWRLQLWLAFLLLCVLSGFAVTVYHLQRTTQLSQLDEELERRVALLNIAVRGGPPPEHGFRRPPPPPPDDEPGSSEFDDKPRRPPRPRGPPPDDGPGPRGGRREVRLTPEVASLFGGTRPNAFYFAAWSRGGSELKRSTNAPSEVPLPEQIGRDTQIHTRVRGDWREAFQFTELGDCVLAGRSLAADLPARQRFAWVLLGAGAAVLAFGLGGGWWLASRAIRPVEDISAAANRISAGNLSERIAGADANNELGRLAGVLNSTFARLEAAFAQQKQFTADASHELRTPIAVLISEAQTTLAHERNAAEYRETVEACLAAAQQMRQLTESLLALARLDAGQELIKRERFDLASEVRECVELIRRLAAQRHVRIHCELIPTPCHGDAERLRQVINNLLTNAIYYNREGGEVRVVTRPENGDACLIVSDAGVGIDAEDLPHIFERFFRADKSRSRAEGRSGLGLAISKAIVDVHRGRIEVTSQPGAGTTFTVRLPGQASGGEDGSFS